MKNFAAPSAVFVMLTLFIVGAAQRTNASSPLTLWDIHGLHGAVRSVEGEFFTLVFAPDGLTARHLAGEVDMIDEWFPDERKKVTTYGRSGERAYFCYDSEGFLIRSVGTDGIETIKDFLVLADGSRVGTTRRRDGTVEIEMYSARGLMVYSRSSGPGGQYQSVWEYNELGDLIAVADVDEFGRYTLIRRGTYVYDDRGNWTEVTDYWWDSLRGRFEAEGLTMRRTITYF